MNRRFRINTHLTMPLGLVAGPGAQYSRHTPGDVVEIDPEKCRGYDRFINGRLRAGDMTELDNEPPRVSSQESTSPTAAVAPHPVKE